MKTKHSEKINSKSSKESCFLSLFVCLSILFLISTIILSTLYFQEKNSNINKKIYTRQLEDTIEERRIPVISNVSEEGGAYGIQGKYDIKNSKYFKYIDIFNMKSSGSLILLEKFKTYQQTSGYTCGEAALIMAINYLSGEVLNETDLAIKAHANKKNGTTIHNLEKLVESLGYEYESKTTFGESSPSLTEEAFSDYIKKVLTNKEPIISLSNDWGGHYSVIIGYDDMGTKDYLEDDVIILADPYDTSDHMSDGYTIFNYQRFYAQMGIKVFNIVDQDYNFIRIKRKNKTN